MGHSRLLRTFTAAATLLFLVFAAPGAFAQARKGTVERITVRGASLEGNLSGDSAERTVFVYLPPSYATSPARRYAVVYLLHGYGLTGERWMTFARVAEGADRAIEAGADEMILVSPDAFTKYSGSMYSASPTTGDWESFIADDLVKFIDGRYRTAAARESRGLAGHSMGGYGTLRIGMKRPDVFSTLYIMSACCLMNDPTPRGGGPGRAAGAPAAQAPAAGQAARGGAAGDGRGAAEGRGGRGNAFGNVQQAQGAAWSPNPNNPPDYLDLPVRDGELQPLVRAKWIANSPLAMLDQHYAALKRYTAIAIDVGNQDSLAASNRQLVQAMTQLGVSHTFEEYEGDHNNRVAERLEKNVLPLFSKALATAPRR